MSFWRAFDKIWKTAAERIASSKRSELIKSEKIYYLSERRRPGGKAMIDTCQWHRYVFAKDWGIAIKNINGKMLEANLIGMKYNITKVTLSYAYKMRVMMTAIILFLMIDGSMTAILFALTGVSNGAILSMN